MDNLPVLGRFGEFFVRVAIIDDTNSRGMTLEGVQLLGPPQRPLQELCLLRHPILFFFSLPQFFLQYKNQLLFAVALLFTLMFQYKTIFNGHLVGSTLRVKSSLNSDCNPQKWNLLEV